MTLVKSYLIRCVFYEYLNGILSLCHSKHNNDLVLVSKTYLFCCGVDQTYVDVLFLTDSCDKMSKKKKKNVIRRKFTMSFIIMKPNTKYRNVTNVKLQHKNQCNNKLLIFELKRKFDQILAVCV